MFPQTLITVMCALILSAPLTSALAADTPAPAPVRATPPADPLAKARALIKQQQWSEAIAELETQKSSPDVNNLLGFAHRKKGHLDHAFMYYDKALAQDPQHKGALEYQGEGFLMAKQLDKAKANLAKLKAICGTSCEEYKDLNEAIEKYSAK